jgi:hypothetical protein
MKLAASSGSVAALAVVAGICLLIPGTALGQAAKAAPAAKSWTMPKTPWGDPDLQGTWTSDDCIGTPMNRPVNLGEKLYYTEQELADRQTRLSRQQQIDLNETVAPDQRVGTGPPSHWVERALRPCRQTSLVVDLPDGRVLDLLPEARTKPSPIGGRQQPQSRFLGGFQLVHRCITRGVV